MFAGRAGGRAVHHSKNAPTAIMPASTPTSLSTRIAVKTHSSIARGQLSLSAIALIDEVVNGSVPKYELDGDRRALP
jgi:hypothetical protein